MKSWLQLFRRLIVGVKALWRTKPFRVTTGGGKYVYALLETSDGGEFIQQVYTLFFLFSRLNGNEGGRTVNLYSCWQEMLDNELGMNYEFIH